MPSSVAESLFDNPCGLDCGRTNLGDGGCQSGVQGLRHFIHRLCLSSGVVGDAGNGPVLFFDDGAGTNDIFADLGVALRELPDSVGNLPGSLARLPRRCGVDHWRWRVAGR